MKWLGGVKMKVKVKVKVMLLGFLVSLSCVSFGYAAHLYELTRVSGSFIVA